MSTTVEVWECPPLAARISMRQCLRNRELVQKDRASAALLGEEEDWPPRSLLLRPCLSCQGLAWWAERTGRGPKQVQVEVSEIARPLAERRARKRWLADRGWHREPGRL